MICKRSAADTSSGEPSWLGQPCPDCGHTTLVHPGPASPALDVCVTCQLLDVAAQVAANRARLDKLPPELPTVPAQVDDLRGRVGRLETEVTP